MFLCRCAHGRACSDEAALLNALETILFPVLSYIPRLEHLPAHRQVNAGFGGLHGGNRHADIEYRVGGFEARRA